MKIVKIISQCRRDFDAEMICEFCGNTSKMNSGYDDRFYHDEVIPNMVCGKCNKSTKSEGGKIDYIETKYSPNQIV